MKRGDEYLCYFGEDHNLIRAKKGEWKILIFDYFADDREFYESNGYCLDKSIGDKWLKLSPAIKIMFGLK